MSTIRLKLQFKNGHVVPIIYEMGDINKLSGFYMKSKKWYYSVSDVRTDAPGFDQCGLYCQRKCDWSSYTDDTPYTVKTNGGPAILMGESLANAKNVSSIVAAGMKKCLLLTFITNFQTIKEVGRRVLPHYLICGDLQQLVDTTHFYILWGKPQTPDHTGYSGNLDKYIDITLHLYAEDKDLQL